MSAKEDLPGNDSKTVQVTVVVFYNGTYVVESKEDPALQIVEIVFLVVVFLVSFVSNIFLLATIVSSYTLRRVPFNLLLANLSAVFLVECLANMSVAILYVSTDKWKHSCEPSSFFVQLVTLEVTFSLCLMCAESMLLVWQPFRFQSYLTVKKQLVATATMWTAGTLLCVPLLLQSIKSRFFPSRFGCASAGEDGFVHAVFLTLWCYCLMPVLGLGCLVSLGIRQYNEYRIQRRKTGVNYSDVFMQGDLWTEWVNFKVVAWLALFYLLLELPYIVVHQISALKAYPPEKEFDNSTLITPVVEKTPRYETVFTWFRYIYSCLFALLVFKMRKDIRHKFRALMNCCERSVARDHSAGPVVKQETKKTVKANPVLPLSLSTPVLYISPDGLCLRQLDPDANPSSKYANSQPKFISYLCDNSTASSFDNSLNETLEGRFSKESEMTLPDMGSSFPVPEEVPLKDIAEIFEQESPPPPKKSVRFADTLTIFRSMTPRSPTPQWVLTKSKSERKPSKIPTRIRKVTPWKVESSGIKSPRVKSGSKWTTTSNIKRKSKFSRWKVKKL